MRPNTPTDFWARVQIGEPDACWPWLGHKIRRGYGQLSVAGRLWLAHRYAYSISNNREPGLLLVCHTCDNPPCCNPTHLFLGTVADNTRDAQAKGRLAKGERIGVSRLTASAVREIRARFVAGESKAALARAFSVTPRSVHLVVIEETWRHV